MSRPVAGCWEAGQAEVGGPWLSRGCRLHGGLAGPSEPWTRSPVSRIRGQLQHLACTAGDAPFFKTIIHISNFYAHFFYFASYVKKLSVELVTVIFMIAFHSNSENSFQILVKNSTVTNQLVFSPLSV